MEFSHIFPSFSLVFYTISTIFACINCVFIYESVCNVRFELSCPSACQWVGEVNSHWRHLVSGCSNTASPLPLVLFTCFINVFNCHRWKRAPTGAEQHPSSLTSTRHTSPSPAVLAYKSHRKHSDFSRMIFVPSVLGNAAICEFRSYLKKEGGGKKNKATIYPNTEAHKTDKTRKLKKI